MHLISQVERQNLARQVALFEEEIAQKQQELEHYNANDPERYEALSTSLFIMHITWFIKPRVHIIFCRASCGGCKRQCK